MAGPGPMRRRGGTWGGGGWLGEGDGRWFEERVTKNARSSLATALWSPASHAPLSLHNCVAAAGSVGAGAALGDRRARAVWSTKNTNAEKKHARAATPTPARRTPPPARTVCTCMHRTREGGGQQWREGPGTRPRFSHRQATSRSKHKGAGCCRAPPSSHAALAHIARPLRNAREAGGVTPTPQTLTSITPFGPTALISAGVASPGLAPVLAPAGRVVDTPRAPAPRAARVARRRRAALLEDIKKVRFFCECVSRAKKKRSSVQRTASLALCVYVSTLRWFALSPYVWCGLEARCEAAEGGRRGSPARPPLFRHNTRSRSLALALSLSSSLLPTKKHHDQKRKENERKKKNGGKSLARSLSLNKQTMECTRP